MLSQDVTNPPLALDDLSAVDISDVYGQAQKRLGRSFNSEGAHYSRVNGTAGFTTDAETWVRLSWRRTPHMNTHSWTGTEMSETIQDVPRPQWIATATWADNDRGVTWKAEETTLAPSPAISTTADLTTDPGLPGPWWDALHDALRALSSHPTDRVALEQAHLTRRIREVYGTDIDTHVPVQDWVCAHGDLGYANVTGPEFTLLDWESWGMAPRGWDAACLWSASLGVPRVAEHVRVRFDDVLSTRAGRLCQLLLCANVARAAKRTGRTLTIKPIMEQTADIILAELS
ncbi:MULTISPECIES: aminoglycoside phosphotransferase [unclassified Nocardiopsis]|uniref:aminoglycoside phosphotransferase n=1 Tax=unclassified Nocardiopsis TaxID=2649073 RepID=UPI001F2E7EC1|nr:MULTISPECIES: aminoglycoside phosphotransferase [unclassified Nocardiopsis]